MGGSVHLPELAPLPERPSAADVHEALDFATAGRPDGPLRVLAAEVLHLRKFCGAAALLAEFDGLRAENKRLRNELNEEAGYGQQLEQRALRAERAGA